MRFNMLGPIEKIVAEYGRGGVDQLFLDAKRGRLVATNGHCLVVLKVQPEPDDTSGYLPTEAVACARKAAQKAGMANMVSVVANGTVDVVDISTGTKTCFQRRQGQQYPDYEKVLPKPDRAPDFVVDLDLLTKAAAALRAERGQYNSLALWLEDGKALIMTEPAGGIGVVMGLNTTKDWASRLDPLGEKPKPVKKETATRKPAGKVVTLAKPDEKPQPPDPPPTTPANQQAA